MSSSNGTVNDVSSQLWADRSIMLGTVLASAAYGLVFALYVRSVRLTLQKSTQKHKLRWSIYNGVIFLLATVGFCLEARWNTMIFVDYHDYAGGPYAFVIENTGNWVHVSMLTVQILLNWLGDLVLLYRFRTIHDRPWNSLNSYRLLIFPGLMFVASVGLGVAFLVRLGTSGINIYDKALIGLAISYMAITVVLNVILTGAITIIVRAHFVPMTDKQQPTPCTSSAAMLIESASLYTIAALGCIVSCGLSSPLVNIFAPLLRQIQAICPLLISIRVSEGYTTTIINISSSKVRSQSSRERMRVTDTVLENV